MGFFVGALFIIAGIVGLSLKTYFGAQTLVSIILIVVGAIPVAITLGFLVVMILAAILAVFD
jgi:hypothetical protein